MQAVLLYRGRGPGTMITATSRPDGPMMTLHASVNGSAVYLDNWAMGDLAEGDPSRRRRFIDAVRSGMELIFSVTNAAELSGPQGLSARAVREFLDEIGPRWFPVELNPVEVMNRENRGESPSKACISENLLKSFVSDRMCVYTPGSGKVIDLSDDFFRLGAMLDWVCPQRESIRKGSDAMDELLREKFGKAAATSKEDAFLLDARFPRIPFDASRPATFVFLNLLRVVVAEGGLLKKGDGMDFCHAVMASAFASFATLDKRWKRRVASLPKPNRLARIYSGQELDNMVTDIESFTALVRAASPSESASS